MTTAITADGPIFQPLSMRGMNFPNRLLRSSIGGRTCTFDGSVTPVWQHFERRFAQGGVGGIVSTTFHVDQGRLSPPQYPSIGLQSHVAPLRECLARIRGEHDVRYIVQIGDTGYVTYSSLFAEPSDGLSSSGGFDFGFGYTNRRRAMTEAQIRQAIDNHAIGAARAREAGADGVEITAAKGYLIHQFLNPGINTRDDDWGGSADKRFRLLECVLKAVRERVGDDFIMGVRMAGADHNQDPLGLWLARLPWHFFPAERRHGNSAEQMRDYARRIEALGADYLHITAGFGFPNPHDVPGRFPFEEVRMFFDSVRHLSAKAAVRAALTHLGPTALLDAVANIGWRPGVAVNLPYAAAIRKVVGIPVIANGGFQDQDVVAGAISGGSCDMVSMARALIANPDLPHHFRSGRHQRPRCSQCNKCVGRSPTSPVGCYDVGRFGSEGEMNEEILRLNTGNG